MKNSNKIGLVSALIAVISIFLPWASASSSFSMGSLGSSSYNSEAYAGISLGYGILGLIMGVVSLYFCYTRNKKSWILGGLMFAESVFYLISITVAGGKGTSNYGEYSASFSVNLNPQFGLFIYIISSFILFISTIKDRNN